MTAFTLQSSHRKVDDECASDMFSVSETEARTLSNEPQGDLRQLHLQLLTSIYCSHCFYVIVLV